MFRSVGATPLDGGPTLNPSTYELLAGIHSVPAEEVVVLPNSGNVRMAADRAAELSDKTVRVVPSRSQQAGLAAAVALEVTRTRRRQRRRDGRRRWTRSAPAPSPRPPATTASSASAPARRSASSRRSSSPGATPRRRCAPCSPTLGTEAELLTLIAGPDAPLGEAEIAALVPDGVEFELSDGGQPSYWWLVAAE